MLSSFFFWGGGGGGGVGKGNTREEFKKEQYVDGKIPGNNHEHSHTLTYLSISPKLSAVHLLHQQMCG
jgi:hypothetical protein